MSDRMDLYIEKVLARMMIDDAQRREIERELRNHIQEGISDAQARGLAKNLAEEEAMRVFGEPSFLGKYFKSNTGMVWLFFERISFTICIFLIFSFLLRISANSDSVDDIIMKNAFLVCLAYGCMCSIWERIEINGGIHIHRFPFAVKKISFESIKAVYFQKGHLFGKRNFVIEYEGGIAKIKGGFRGIRVCGFALAVLVPDRMEKSVAEHLRGLRLRVRSEPLVRKILHTAIWAALAAIFALCWGDLWRGEGIPWSILWVLPGALLAFWFQASLHADRSRSGLCYLLVVMLLMAFLNLFSAYFLGGLLWARWMLVIIGFCIISPISLVWWPWSRRALVLATALGALTVFASRLLLPTVDFPRREVIHCVASALSKNSFGVPEGIKWREDGKPAVWLNKSEDGRSTINVLTPDGEIASHQPEGTEWTFFPSPDPETPMFLQQVFDAGPQNLYRFENNSNLVGLENMPPRMKFSPLFIRIYSNPWSPDGKFLLVPIDETRGEDPRAVPKIAAVEVATGRVIYLDSDKGA